MRERRANAPHRARRRQADRGAPQASVNGHVAEPVRGAARRGAAPQDKVVVLAVTPSAEASAIAALKANRCAKCRSTFVMREPAFLHCYYCGAMTRIPSGSLLEQELFELRSGLRLAS